jgi:hypothetical protein
MPKISENLERLKSICVKVWFIAIEKEWKIKFMKLIIKNAFVFFAFPIVLISLSMPVFSACSGSPPQNMGILQPGIDFCWNNPAVCGLACPSEPCPSIDCTASESALATCNSNLSTANGSLTRCNTEKGTLNTNLTRCNTEKGTLNTNLTRCNTEKGTLNANFTRCNTEKGTLNANFTRCNTEKGTLNANWSQCNAEKNTLNANLTQSNAEKNTLNANLTQSNAEKAQCQTDKNNCNTNLTQSNAEKAQCQTDKGICNTNLTNCNTDKATLNTNCNTEKATLNTNIQTLTNTSCDTELPASAQQQNHSSKKLYIPTVELAGVNEVYEVDMCENEVPLEGDNSLKTLTLRNMKQLTTFFNLTTAKALNISPTSFDLVVKLNQPGEVYYVVKEKSAGQLTPDDFSNYKTIRIGENNQAIGSVKELKAGTSYTVYLVTDLNNIPNDLEKLKALEVTTVNK